jgi:hypothetical protein
MVEFARRTCSQKVQSVYPGIARQLALLAEQKFVTQRDRLLQDIPKLLHCASVKLCRVV